ncbi:hypothetical protein F5Y16DRAFT_369156 [Xylariaceae sp. FL0255]|nr:hypothetical protein F5Y16DRAFT_369156 [Xylariaceae sp. FL0255]
MRHIRALSSKPVPKKKSAPSHSPSSRYPPNLDAINAAAIDQQESPFFTTLPPEIRLMIYAECWRFSGLAQHWFNIPDRPGVQRASSPCVIDHNSPEPYMDWIYDQDAAEKIQSWVHLCQVLLPTQSPWRNHWMCRETAKSNHWRQPVKIFLPVLLTCRKMYIEGRASIADSVTFVLHDNRTTLSFLMVDPPPIMSDLRHLQISLNFSTAELTHPNTQWHHSHWSLLCKRLAELDRLEHVSIRLHPGDNFRVNHFARIKALYDAVPENLRHKVTINVPLDPDEEYQGFQNPSLNLSRDVTLAPPDVKLVRRGNPRLDRFGAMPNIFDEVELRNGVITGNPARRSTWIIALRGLVFCFCLFPAILVVGGNEFVKQVRESRLRRRFARAAQNME